MQMDDEIAGLGAVDGLLRLGAPGLLGARVVGEEPDDVDLGRVAKFMAFERFEFTAENKVQALRLLFGVSLGSEIVMVSFP